MLPARSCKSSTFWGDHVHLGVLLQRSDGFVSCVGSCLYYLFATEVIEAQHELRVSGERLGRGHVLYTVLFPEPITIAECPQAAFRAYACTGKKTTRMVLCPAIDRMGRVKMGQAE